MTVVEDNYEYSHVLVTG